MLSDWRSGLLETGKAGLRRLTDDSKVTALEKELKRVKRLVGDLMLAKKVLEKRSARHECGSLFRGGGRIREPGLLGLREAPLRQGPGVPVVGCVLLDALCAAGGGCVSRPTEAEGPQAGVVG